MWNRNLLIALVLAVAACSLAAPLASGGGKVVPRIVFPVVGKVTYHNDFGDSRGRLAHQGIDIMAAKKSPVVAAEDGKITFRARSASAGCMLYLYGRSGTMYEYIHLNNDLTMKNDNKGKCVAGTAYANGLKNGAKVKAGQVIGYVGDSGDANGLDSHLHFELHPNGHHAVSPYRNLKRARVLLFAARPGAEVSFNLKGKLIEADSVSGTLSMRVSSLTSSDGLELKKLSRKLTLALVLGTLVSDENADTYPLSVLDDLEANSAIAVATTTAPLTLAAETGAALALATADVFIPAQYLARTTG